VSRTKQRAHDSHRFLAEHAGEPCSQGESPRHTQTHQHQTVMRAPEQILRMSEKSKILRDEKALCRLCRLPDISVRLTAHPFEPYIFHVMTERPSVWSKDSGRFSSNLTFMQRRASAAPACLFLADAQRKPPPLATHPPLSSGSPRGFLCRRPFRQAREQRPQTSRAPLDHRFTAANLATPLEILVVVETSCRRIPSTATACNARIHSGLPCCLNFHRVKSHVNLCSEN